MQPQVVNYQCPNCLAPLRFDGATSKLVCDSCDSTYTTEQVEKYFADQEAAAVASGVDPQWDISLTGNYTEEEAAQLRGYLCPSCAAEIILDATTVASSCPWCGNPTIVPGQFNNDLRPDYVLPFRLSREQAIAALKKHYSGKRFLPKAFAAGNHIEEIRGVYVPFWLFSGQAEAFMRFRAEKTHSFTQGNYRITHTDHYRVIREGTVTFNAVPVDGSARMPDKHMDSIEPYDFSAFKPFSTAYLPGFVADKYDEDAATCAPRANARILQSTENAFTRTLSGYSMVSRLQHQISLSNSKVEYALMPVWMLTTKWHDQTFLFAMNGQTGKLIGDLPVDGGAFWSWFLRIFVGVAAISAVVLFIGGIV